MKAVHTRSARSSDTDDHGRDVETPTDGLQGAHSH